MNQSLEQKRQVLRLIYKTPNELKNIPSISTSSSILPQNNLTSFEIYHDPESGMDIVLWEDITSVFKYAKYIRDGIEILSFLKGSDFT
jgi:hypothetical protein